MTVNYGLTRFLPECPTTSYLVLTHNSNSYFLASFMKITAAVNVLSYCFEFKTKAGILQHAAWINSRVLSQFVEHFWICFRSKDCAGLFTTIILLSTKCLAPIEMDYSYRHKVAQNSEGFERNPLLSLIPVPPNNNLYAPYFTALGVDFGLYIVFMGTWSL